MQPPVDVQTGGATITETIKPNRNPERIVITFESGDELEIKNVDKIRAITRTGAYIRPQLPDLLTALLEKKVEWLILPQTSIKVKMTPKNEYEEGEMKSLTGDVYWPMKRIAEIIVI